MEKSKLESKRESTELTIEKALEFAGDNSSYQKRRLFRMAAVILSLAILTNKLTMQGTPLLLAFLLASAAGQLLSAAYLNLRTATQGLAASALAAALLYPLSAPLTSLAYLALGFFGRAFFASSLVYFNEIGGDRFRAWSIIVVFGVWGASYLISSVEWMLGWPRWVWYYLLIFLPLMANSYLVLRVWKPSPYFLFTHKFYSEAKMVLNEIAEENLRPHLPYALEGQQVEEALGQKVPFFQIMYEPLLRKITVPLMVVWIYRQYIYYGCFVLIPELSHEYSKNYILISISETVAVLMSYPIRLKIRRVNAIFALLLLILASSLLCSFTTLDHDCRQKGNACSAKYLYRVAMLLIRFSIALLGNILINYTLEVYPSNVRNSAYSLLLTLSALGSLLPSLNAAFVHAAYSGFIPFVPATILAAYFVTRLPETYGKMKIEKLEQLQIKAALIPLSTWKNFSI